MRKRILLLCIVLALVAGCTPARPASEALITPVTVSSTPTAGAPANMPTSPAATAVIAPPATTALVQPPVEQSPATAAAATLAALPPPPTPTGLLQGPYAVVDVARKDTLNVRKEPDEHASILDRLAPDATGILATGRSQVNGNDRWMELARPRGNGTGWVNAVYLTEYVAPPDFCGDNQVKILLERFEEAITNRDGRLLSSLVSPAHDFNVTYLHTGNTAGYSREEARWVFDSTYQMNWGTHPASGQQVKGSFQEKVLPDLQDVLNTKYQKVCNSLTTGGKSYAFEWPAMYRNINYYSLYKPGPPGQELAWRTWLVGVEYVDHQPYLFSLMHLFWEP
jgi:hypothetical protein